MLQLFDDGRFAVAERSCLREVRFQRGELRFVGLAAWRRSAWPGAVAEVTKAGAAGALQDFRDDAFEAFVEAARRRFLRLRLSVGYFGEHARCWLNLDNKKPKAVGLGRRFEKWTRADSSSRLCRHFPPKAFALWSS